MTAANVGSALLPATFTVTVAILSELRPLASFTATVKAAKVPVTLLPALKSMVSVAVKLSFTAKATPPLLREPLLMLLITKLMPAAYFGVPLGFTSSKSLTASLSAKATKLMPSAVLRLALKDAAVVMVGA